MSTKRSRKSSTSVLSAKRKTSKRKVTRARRVGSSLVLAEPHLVARSHSTSPIRRAFKENASLRLAWENDVVFHVTRNLLLLRKYRAESQTGVAAAAGTSQAKIARIESGLDNITLRTLAKLIKALDGRFRVSVSPSEVSIPFCPDWWDWLSVEGGAAKWVFQRAALVDDGETKMAAMAWTAPSDGPLLPPPGP